MKTRVNTFLVAGGVLATVFTAQATVYLQDGFASSAYAVGTDGLGKLHNKGANETGFSSANKWATGDSSVTRCTNSGLDFPEIMITEKNCVRATVASFSNYAGGNYRPALGGPLVEAGKLDVANALPSLDLAGQSRLYKHTYDIGCFENQGGKFVLTVR